MHESFLTSREAEETVSVTVRFLWRDDKRAEVSVLGLIDHAKAESRPPDVERLT